MTSTPVERFFQAATARIAYAEWGRGGQPVVFLIHATGFHGRCWDEAVRALPSGLNVVAVDLRGHGRSQKTGPITNWAEPARDIAEIVEHLNLDGAIGAGHSMGGHILVQIAAANPRAFRRLVLIDPVIMAPEMYSGAPFWPPGTEHPVARRRNSWASWQEMFDAFKNRNPYSLWVPKVLEDYCRYGVQPANGGGFELACPPAVEASIYMGSLGTDIYDAVRKVTAPVTILRAKERAPGPRDQLDFSASPTWPKLSGVFANASDVHLPELTHFIPMQDPALVARYIAGRD
ncbi:MAG: alpha/beta fold hydrolase [Micropepsaceae bacterium]